MYNFHFALKDDCTIGDSSGDRLTSGLDDGRSACYLANGDSAAAARLFVEEGIHSIDPDHGAYTDSAFVLLEPDHANCFMAA